MEGRLEVQVNLKSNGSCGFLLPVKELLTIGEVARRSGVAASALRFYEERELITAVRGGLATVDSDERCCAGSPSSSSRSESG